MEKKGLGSSNIAGAFVMYFTVGIVKLSTKLETMGEQRLGSSNNGLF